MSIILESNNYQQFVISPFHRELKKTKRLEKSMLKCGFLDAFPVMVRRLNDGRLEILDGHHRFVVAVSLGISVKYLELTKEVLEKINIAELNQTSVPWSMEDWLTCHVRTGKEAYEAVLAYHKKTKIPITACISMLGGNNAGKGNLNKPFKEGEYRLGDQHHANLVADLVLHCANHRVSFARNTYFVQALSKICWAKGFDPEVMKKRITSNWAHMTPAPTRNTYVIMLEYIYNRGNPEKISLAFNAEQAEAA